ncbi:UNVERIFIED_CONTAM: hypothetical protein ITH36_24460, partial [Salmonella enterica subsp. enterica serovar Weltevreden]
LNVMSNTLFDTYLEVETSKELWDKLEAKYVSEDASSKKFLVANFMKYVMVDSRPVMEQYHELLRLFGQFTQNKMAMDETIYVSSIIEKLPPSWKEFKNGLKHKKEEMSLLDLGSSLRIEENCRMEESGKKSTVDSTTINFVEAGESSKQNNGKRKFKPKNNKSSDSNKKPKGACWICGKSGHFRADCRFKKKKDIVQGQGFK